MIMNERTIRSVKDATVAIGLIDKTDTRTPRAILGSDFFVDSKGYAITAKHVPDECYKMLEVYRAQKAFTLNTIILILGFIVLLLTQTR